MATPWEYPAGVTGAEFYDDDEPEDDCEVRQSVKSCLRYMRRSYMDYDDPYEQPGWVKKERL